MHSNPFAKVVTPCCLAPVRTDEIPSWPEGIAEEGSVLPFDILRERTIFYINDAQGILDLRERLQRAVESIKFTKASSPIHDIIHSIKKDAKVYADVESGNISGNDGTTDREVMRHILEKLVVEKSHCMKGLWM